MTDPISTLITIMLDDNVATRRRVEAAEHLLSYECPSEAIEEAKAFLASVFENEDRPVEIRLDALKLMRKASAKKVTPGTAHVRDDAAFIETRRAIEIASRRVALWEAGAWPPPEGCYADLESPDYVPIPTEVYPEDEGVTDTGVLLRNARLRHERKLRGESS